MHKIQMIIACLALLILLAAIGCSNNDECASCPDLTTPLGHARGSLVLAPGATIMPELQVFSNGAVAPNLDSVKVGDSLVDKNYWNVAGQISFADAHWVISFFETGNPSTYMYEHGDAATIRIWGEGRSSSCQVKILDPNLATANITIPVAMADTISPGGSDTVYWNKVEHVDYYAVMIAWFVTSGGDSRYVFAYYYATDTSFIVTGAMSPPDSVLNFNVHITPFNGPDPRTGQSNWSGALLDGVVYSYGYNAMTTIVVRSPIGSPEKALSEWMIEQPERSPEEMVANVYKKFEK